MIEDISQAARRLDRALMNIPWWAWPASMLALAVAMWAAALILQPMGEWTGIAGQRIGETCAFITATGQPCPNCGMTRAFLWSARLHLLRGFLYSPAGAALFWWITVAGGIGAVRLWTRDPRRLAPRWQVFVGWSAVWIVLYLVTWFLRLGGINPLP